MRVDDWLARAAEALPERPALVAGDRTLSFAELESEARSTARRLAGAGVGRGDRVALVAGADGRHVVLLHALTKLGAVAVPLDPSAPAPDIDRLLAAAGAEAGACARSESWPRRRRPDDRARRRTSTPTTCTA